MATTTPNFGWPVPTSTDLVKDGATAIESLGDSIDASLLDLKGGTSGQVLSKNSNTDMDFTWVTSDDANAIQNAIVDAKGDLIAATAADTPARLAVGTNGQVLTADSTAATGLKWATAGGGGKILQTVFGSSVNLVNNTTSTYVTTGATATITPSAATSKIIILASINGLYWDSGTTSLDFKLVRGATAIAAITRVQEGMANATSTSSVNFTYQDSPSTTSATTYDVTYATTTPTGRARVGHPATGATNSIQSMILMEVGA